MSTHNIGFYEEISKLSPYYHQILSNLHLISSAASYCVMPIGEVIEQACCSVIFHLICMTKMNTRLQLVNAKVHFFVK